MMNIGQKNSETAWKPHVPPENTLHFSVEMKYTGKQDGKTAMMARTHLSARWSVIKKAPWPRLRKMRVVANATQVQNGRVYGETDAAFHRGMPVSLKTPFPAR